MSIKASLVMLVFCALLSACAPSSVPAAEIKFVEHDYIELHKIKQISLFRSAVGHDYSADDDVESCRSMKHYYMGMDEVDWSGIRIFSPVDGTVLDIRTDSAGEQIHIQSSLYPQYIFKLFHVVLTIPLSETDSVAAGQIIGHHVSGATYSDIAVVNQPVSGPRQLVSFFDVMTDLLFLQYIQRGIKDRTYLIITKEQRDANPLTCVGETFTYTGYLTNWISLTKTGSWDPMVMLLMLGTGGP